MSAVSAVVARNARSAFRWLSDVAISPLLKSSRASAVNWSRIASKSPSRSGGFTASTTSMSSPSAAAVARAGPELSLTPTT